MAALDEAWQDSDFSLLLACSHCGGEIAVSTDDRAARCEHCGSAHLVAKTGGVAGFLIPNAIAGAVEAMEAFLDDTKRRRLLSRSLEEDGSSTAPLDPLGEEAARLVASALDDLLPRGLSPRSDLPERVLQAEIEAWSEDVRSRRRLIDYRFFYAPYWHLQGRFYECVIGRDTKARKQARVAVKGVEHSRIACAPDLALPAMGALSSIRALRPLSEAVAARLPVLALADPGTAMQDQFERWKDIRLVRDLQPIARRGEAWPRGAFLILRPYHLLSIRGGERIRHLLFDGYSRRSVAALEDVEAARLVPEIGLRGFTEPAFELRPMRCPICGANLPLDREGEVRFCEQCGRGFALRGAELEAEPYDVELADPEPKKAILLPFWRFAFTLANGNGKRFRSLAELRRELGARAVMGAGDEPLDVPAFRPADRRRAFEVYQHLAALDPGPTPRTVEGPARPELDLPAPARFVTIPKAEAAFAARHALLLHLDEHDLLNASPGRLRELLIDAPLEIGPPRLVLRAFRRGEVTPIAAALGV